MEPLPRSSAHDEIKHRPHAGQREHARAARENALLDHHIEELLSAFADLSDLQERPVAD